jgi:hypothetical protein
LYKRVCVLIYI